MYVTKFVDNTQYGQSSVVQYASYLEKESLAQGGNTRQFSAYLDKQNDVVRVEGREYFFNGESEHFGTEDLVKRIDSNVRGLKRREARYYTFSISPSAEELTHLRRTIADTRQALVDAGEDIPDTLEDDLMRRYLKDYAKQCMDAYARNFGHPEIHDNHDLLWYGMVEKDRYWKNHDPEVRTNARIDRKIALLQKHLGKGQDEKLQQQIAALERKYVRESKVRVGGSDEILRPMMSKTGDNWHIHIMVSRRDITNSINLSPNANGRGSSRHVLNGKAVRVGFDREAYKIACEKTFDRLFAHQRLQTESYEASKCLRRQSAFAFERQRIKDRAVRRREAVEFQRLSYGGYREYFEQLLQSERLEGRQLLQLKRQLVRQLQRLDPHLDTEELMSYNLEELQNEIQRLEDSQDLSMPMMGHGMLASLGDRAIQTSGLQGYHPVTTTYRMLRRGVVMHRAVDRRREIFEHWVDIYMEAWYKENYTFESIAAYRQADILLAQNQYLEQNLEGASALLANANDMGAKIELDWVKAFQQSSWPQREQDMIQFCAREVFGPDAEGVRSFAAYEQMTRERLLPHVARQHLQDLKQNCSCTSLDRLRQQIEYLPEERAAKLRAAFETFLQKQDGTLRQLKGILENTQLTVHAKEEALLKFSLGNKDLIRCLGDMRSGMLKILEKLYPKMRGTELSERLGKLTAGLQNVVRDRKQFMAKEVIDTFIERELPGYVPLIEKQSQLEELLHDLIPDAEKYAERLKEVRDELSRRLAPTVKQAFERHGQRLFGPEVHLHNEHDFMAYVERHIAPEQVKTYRDSLRTVYPQIEERRRELVQAFVKTLPQDQLDIVRRQQRYINAHIDRRYPASVAKKKKEELQRLVASKISRPLPKTEYKIFGAKERQQIINRATQRTAQSVKTILPVTPRQIAFKAATQLIKILTKGF